jgi:hypothetical protein
MELLCPGFEDDIRGTYLFFLPLDLKREIREFYYFVPENRRDRKGRKIGVWNYYDDEGRLVKSLTYNKGVMTRKWILDREMRVNRRTCERFYY